MHSLSISGYGAASGRSREPSREREPPRLYLSARTHTYIRIYIVHVHMHSHIRHAHSTLHADRNAHTSSGNFYIHRGPSVSRRCDRGWRTEQGDDSQRQNTWTRLSILLRLETRALSYSIKIREILLTAFDEIFINVCISSMYASKYIYVFRRQSVSVYRGERGKMGRRVKTALRKKYSGFRDAA